MIKYPDKVWHRHLLILIGLLSYAFIVYKLFNFDGWGQLQDLLRYGWIAILLFILLQLAMAAINVGFESLKWHVLIKDFSNQLFSISVRQVLSGIASGIVTPSRIGEPIGRIIGIPKHYRVLAVGLTFIGGAIQTLVIFITGMAAIAILSTAYNSHTGWSRTVPQGTLALGIMAGCITLFFTTAMLIFPSKTRVWKQYFYRHLNCISLKKWGIVVLLTIVRYLIFTAQMVIALCFVGGWTHFGQFMMLVPVYYFIITLIPGFLFTELGIRGSVAIILFGNIANNAQVILAVFFVWVINVAIPTLAGATIQLIQHSPTKISYK